MTNLVYYYYYYFYINLMPRETLPIGDCTSFHDEQRLAS